MKILPTLSLIGALSLPFLAVGQESLVRSLRWMDKVSAVTETSEGKAANTSKVLGDFGTNGSPLLADAWLDMDRGALPIWHESIPLASGTNSFTVSLADVRYEVVPAELLRQIPDLGNVSTEPVVQTSVGYERKLPVGHVSIEPFRIGSSGQVERLLEFRMVVDQVGATGPAPRPKSYPTSSALQSGDWYRFNVFNDGVYKITQANLQAMGVDVNGLASDRINIYGSHFGLLPFENNVDRPTDMLVNAVEVVDGGDGNLGPNDYILFYASGAQRWERSENGFKHIKNVYCDSAAYFVGIDIEPPVRIGSTALTDAPVTNTVNAFNDRQFIERDLANMIKSGRTWYGEYFDLTTTYNFNFNIPFPVAGDTSILVMTGVGRTLGTQNSSSFTITSNAGLNADFPVLGSSTNYTAAWGRGFSQRLPFVASTSPLSLSITWNKFNPITSVAYLDYLELNCRRELRMVGNQLAFRDLRSIGPGNVSEFVLDQAQTVSRIWEITDPTDTRRVDYTEDGTSKRFRLTTDSLREFIAFRDVDFLSPTPIGPVPNQNLHATAIPTDMIIVCPPEFQSAAIRLAERRISEGLSVNVVSPQQVYNEFSSGARDATAIKRYMRMLYDKAGSDPLMFPRYLLLFGDGSYNNLSVAPINQNYIPSYQTEESLDPKKSYASDDYFGLLDLEDGEGPGDPMDIGVGRFPVSSLEQANAMVDKVLSYDQYKLMGLTGSSCAENGDGGLADWRTHVLFASDDQEGEGYEGTIHMSQSDGLARRVEREYPELNVSKIYLDAYQQISTPGGERYPQAATELQERVEKGLLVVNYVGHGGEVGWAHERFLDNSTILGWRNADRLPLFMTATCEFTRWDDPGRTSAGEYVFLNPDGGGIALMTTSRLAFSNANDDLANAFYDHVFEATDEHGRIQRLGDISRKTKVDMSMAGSGQVNHRNFAVIGDPSMRLALPRNPIRINSITDTLGTAIDTLKALATVRIQGYVDDGNGQPMTDFNGIVIPTVYDKKQQQATLANDGGSPFLFYLRNNIIYRGRATVSNGEFSFTFVVPRDINYQVDTGRVSCYAESISMNAGGFDNTALVGSTATDVAEDLTGPVVNLFLNDENFVPGGLTDQDPLLFGKLFDENGINTVGSSIGHDLLAVLDENTEQAIVLNDLYEADLDTYKSGEVRYRLSDLAEGPHTLRLKAWDVFNNSSESTTDFVVSSSEELALDHVLNYPNPFTTHTEFFFEHNRPCITLDVQVQVFTVSGRLVKTISRQLACNGYRSEGLAWNGLDDFGDKLGRGVYVYRLNVATQEGERAEKFEKLVILR